MIMNIIQFQKIYIDVESIELYHQIVLNSWRTLVNQSSKESMGFWDGLLSTSWDNGTLSLTIT